MLDIKSCQDSVNWMLTNRLLINDHNVIVINLKPPLLLVHLVLILLFGLLIPKALF